MNLVYGSLVAFIVTTIVTESYIFSPIRSLVHRMNKHAGVLFGCFLCFGTWVGVGLGFLIQGPLNPILTGLAYHAISYLIYTLRCLVDDLRIRLQH